MYKPIYFLCLNAALCLAVACQAQGYCADGNVYLTENHPVAYDDVVYKQAPAIDEWFFEIPEDLRLRVYYPTDLAPGAQRPLVVLIHGGFFIAGNYLDFDAFARNLAERGFVAATIGYRLCKRNDCLLANVFTPCNISWGSSFMPSAYVAAVDANDALRWLQTHADDYFIDPENVAVAGHSAGAFTALNVAFMDQTEIQELIPGAGVPGHDYISEPLDPVGGIRAVVSMAGATFNLDWMNAEITEENIALGLVHGTADGIVAYDTRAAVPCCNTFQTLVHGACPMAQRVDSLDGNVYLLSGEGFGHDIGEGAFYDALETQVPAFLVKTLLCNEPIALHTSVERTPALPVCPDGSGQAASLCTALPLMPGGITTALQEVGTSASILQASPSPLTGDMLHLRLELPESGEYQLAVYDQTGRIRLQQKRTLPAGAQQLKIDVKLPAGLYFLHFSGENTRFPTLKIVKQAP